MNQPSPLIPIEQYASIKTFNLYILSYHLYSFFFKFLIRFFNLA